MTHFFISYNGKDKEWAEWVAWQLEAAGYGTVIQAWDFRPGGNFVLDMQQAAEEAERTIAILSQNYLDALYTQPEWAAAFAQDPTGAQKTLLPVRIQDCRLKGLLSQIVTIDLVGKPEAEARDLLLSGIKTGRA
ncbi:MAG: toll/interleukin-1 receptor domain-containing protein, partial [Anaerolineae bacterium]|nr:toll/interleukin-1 receptor domain-containing protein [Anaerolineae bacterium]